MEKLKNLLKKVLTREVIMYIIFGVLTTLVNLIVSFVLEGPFKLDGAWASAIGIVASILFAYFTNRKMVFNTKAKGFKENFNEFIKFILGRAVTMVIEQGGVVIFYSIMGLAFMPVKLSLTIIVVILNFFFSKFFAFRKKENNKNLPEKKRNKFWLILLVFILPILIISLVFCSQGLFPFGNKYLLVFDEKLQYIGYFGFLRDTILSGDLSGLLYSLTKIDGNMIGFTTYYLLSPLNLILILFDKVNFINAMSIISFVKIGLSALTMYIFLNSRNREKKSIAFKISLALGYALSAYNIAYIGNIMWMDNIYLLPLVFMGIDRLVEKEKPTLYIVMLAISIIICYQIGWMVCIISALYFIYRYCNNLEAINIKNILKYKRKIVIFIISSIVGGVISFVVLIPAITNLSQGNRATFSIKSLFSTQQTNNLLDIISKLYPFSNNESVLSEGCLPKIYTGLLVLYLTVLYFLNTKIDKRKRILSLLIIVFFILSFQIKGPNLIWYGGNPTSGYSYRYSFGLIAFMIIFALETLKYMPEKRTINIATAILITIPIILNICDSEKYLSIVNVIIIIVLLLIYAKLFIKWTISNKYVSISVILLVCVSLELFASTYKIIKYASTSDKVDTNLYRSEILQTQTVIDEVRPKDNEFYRVEKTYNLTDTDSMLYNIYGLSHYSSNIKSNAMNFYRNIGYQQQWMNFGYRYGNTLLMDSINNIKYTISKEKRNDIYPNRTESNINGLYVYENTDVLSVGFAVNKKLQNVNIEEQKVFENQNNIAKAMCNIDTDFLDIYNPASVEKIGEKYYEITIDDIEEDKMAYIYLPNSGMANVNGKDIYLYQGVNPIGLLNGKTVIRIQFSDIYDMDENDLSEQIEIAYENNELVEKMINKLTEQELNIEVFNNTYIKGNIKIKEDNQMLYLGIPYDEGWSIYIDGNKVDSQEVLGYMTTINLDMGEHTIEMRYLPKNLDKSIIISAIGIIGLIILAIYCNRKSKKN